MNKAAGVTLLLILPLPLLYVLSYGPAYMLMVDGQLDVETLNRAYVPICWLHDISPAFQQLLSWYIFDFWMPIWTATH